MQIALDHVLWSGQSKFTFFSYDRYERKRVTESRNHALLRATVGDCLGIVTSRLFIHQIKRNVLLHDIANHATTQDTGRVAGGHVNALYASQTGLTLHDPVYYPEPTQYNALHNAFHAYVLTLFRLAGWDDRTAAAHTSRVLRFEETLASFYVPKKTLQDPSPRTRACNCNGPWPRIPTRSATT
ncbi:hypothetical protein PsorP6_007161 [Peronosclerospora sorghi]|uniref:Uncharacterized protein n=1 Tax=Peronosclerospora sorghi TaxID=230839 RepID=A0ACC0WA13_9STRA|nr:hypothetical protein PsorP6_007161 [Peronosclerospora sorghi]